MQRYFDQFKTCREHDIPTCADACPFKVDILDLKSKIEHNRYNAAYKNIRNSVIFPEIVNALCPGYCENACVRNELDRSVQIHLLEKTAVNNAKKKEPNSYNLPKKEGRIAVVGAGVSGMGFALRFASKKYDVTIFEKSHSPGGHLKGLLDEEIYLEEFQRQFEKEKYTLNLNSEITDINSLVQEGYDVIYVATGNDGMDFGLLDKGTNQYYAKAGGPCMLIGDTAVFAGGSLRGLDTVYALADGNNISKSAEIYLKIKKLEYPAADKPTGALPNESRLIHTPPTKATGEGGCFTDDEAVKEAERCISCQCDRCQSYCDMVGFFEKWPIKMRDEILLTCKPSESMIHKNPAMRYINTCTQCNMFSEICPEGINLCEMVKEARRKIHTLGKTPGGFRQYWLRDMAFANGEYAAITKLPPVGKDNRPGESRSDIDANWNKSGNDNPRPSCQYAFFPGCNLGALNPEYVIKSYKWLLKARPNTGLLLRCCGVPVDWNGDRAVHEEELQKLVDEWESLGKPSLITACMSCSRHLQEYLPQIPVISLYEVLDQWDFEPEENKSECSDNECLNFEKYSYADTYSVFDPCSGRNNSEVQDAVRSLAVKAGLNTQELPQGDKHGCCGFGGLGSIATPDFAKYVADKRGGLSDNPYIVYCSNCRDVFVDNGKPVIHILDALFDVNNITEQPTVTQRRINRVILKERLLKEIWEEKMQMKPEGNIYDLKISPEICRKINKQKLLEEDICHVIQHSEKTGRRTLNPENGHYKAYVEIGSITVWVEYSIEADNIYEIHNVYSHRMQIELEAVFNGRKINE